MVHKIHTTHVVKTKKQQQLLSEVTVGTYRQSVGPVGNTLPDLVVIMVPSMSKPAIWKWRTILNYDFQQGNAINGNTTGNNPGLPTMFLVCVMRHELSNLDLQI